MKRCKCNKKLFFGGNMCQSCLQKELEKIKIKSEKMNRCVFSKLLTVSDLGFFCLMATGRMKCHGLEERKNCPFWRGKI